MNQFRGYREDKRTHTHPLQQVSRCRPGAGEVVNQELSPIVVFLFDGYKKEKKQKTKPHDAETEKNMQEKKNKV